MVQKINEFTFADLIRERRIGDVHIGMPHEELFTRYINFNYGELASRCIDKGIPETFAWSEYRIDDVEISFGPLVGEVVRVRGFTIFPGRTHRERLTCGGLCSIDCEGMYTGTPLVKVEATLDKYKFQLKEFDDTSMIFETISKVQAAFGLQQSGITVFIKFLIYGEPKE